MRRFAAGAGLLVAAIGLLAWARQAGVLDRGNRPTNLLLVSIDTLRADRLGSYGYAPARTPRLDALAASGLRFEQATTVMPLTLPAHASLFTGTFPGFHGVRDNGGFYLGEDHTTLAEVLAGRGYRTGGFVGAFVLDSRWGIAQGFEHYFDDFDLGAHVGAAMDAIQRRGDEVVSKALTWLQQDSERPFFAWIHLYDPHTPYDSAPIEFRRRFPRNVQGAYDSEIAWTDSLVGRLLDALEASGRLDQTLVAVVGDHGESLGEHGEQTHAFFVYDAVVQVPLIVNGPGIPRRVVPDQVRIVDLMPTLLDLLGVETPRQVQGASLMPLTRGEQLPLAALSESWYPRYHYGWSELVALRDGRYKFILAPRPELYDLVEDPGETEDLTGRLAGRAASMREALEKMRSEIAGDAPAVAAPAAMDAETQERLEALGYLGNVSSRALEDRPRGDPKDKIDLYNRLKRGNGASSDGRLDEALQLASEILAEDPEIIAAHILVANVHSQRERHAEALTAYRAALALDPEHQGAMVGLAIAYKELGQLADAEAGLERARQLDPRSSRVLWQLADVHMRAGRLDQAEQLLRESIEGDVDVPRFKLKLGECYVQMERHADAERVLREALRLRPDQKTAHYTIALALEGSGRSGDAEREYEAELELNPKAYRAAFNLARLQLRGGRPREATKRLQQSIEANPDFGTGHLYLAKALLDTGDLEGAERHARQGLASFPDPASAPLGHYVLADIYARRGEKEAEAREIAAAQRLKSGG